MLLPVSNFLDLSAKLNGSFWWRSKHEPSTGSRPGKCKERYTDVVEPLLAFIQFGDSHTIAGFPKASMESAIARGQGKSASGAALENLTLEAIVPPAVALIIESETDNKARTMMDLRHLVKVHGGNSTPTTYLFQKKGRVVFEADDRKIGVDEVLDDAIEAGAEDVETDEDGSIVVWTEPNKTTATAEALLKSHGLKVESADIIWDANEDTKVPLQAEASDAVKSLSALLEALQDNPNVQGVYANVAQGTLADDVWDELQGKLDA